MGESQPLPGDLAVLSAELMAALRAEGVPVNADRGERFARAVALLAPGTTAALYRCALATLVADQAHVPALRRVFQLVFGGIADPAGARGPDGEPSEIPPRPAPVRGPAGAPAATGEASMASAGAAADMPTRQVTFPGMAAAGERLAGRDFAELTDAELAALTAAMRRLRLVLPPRSSRRHRIGPRGRSVDPRATLRHAARAAGHPVELWWRRRRQRPRRLVALCDISGSMAPYARAMLQLLCCAAGGARAEVFTFATRLTRLTRTLSRTDPAAALVDAGRVAPDWSGGTRIGESLRTFNDAYGARGMARGAVVLIVSDGWETGDPAGVGQQMARLSRMAHRIVWANPRTAAPAYRPLVGGMAAAWPYCDAVVSGQRLAALDELLGALADPGGGRRGRADRPGRARVHGAGRGRA